VAGENMGRDTMGDETKGGKNLGRDTIGEDI
jgi:hypothetical protein